MDNDSKSQILQQELMLCNKMLKMDERNFHCWNYRYWVVDIYLKEISLRETSKDPSIEPVEVWLRHQEPLVKTETEMALSLIHKSFSNYSAWHYRAKLMPKFYNLNGLQWVNTYIIPLVNIQEDFSKLKHAFFTDPKD